MSCEMSKNYMMKYFDGELSETEEAQLKQHLESCCGCREEFRSLRDILAAVEGQANTEPEPPSDFEARVMVQVDEIEKKRREKNSRLLVLLYNGATLLSIVMLLIFVADIKQGSVFAAFEKIKGYFDSFSSVTSAVLGVIRDISVLIGSALYVVIQVAFSVFKSYYYVFMALAVLLVAIQELLNYVGTQARGNSR